MLRQTCRSALTQQWQRARVRFRGQREASEKNVHFSARVVALNSRMQNLQKQLKESQSREKALMLELDEVREVAAAPPQQQPSSPSFTPNGRKVSLFLDGHVLSQASPCACLELSICDGYERRIPHLQL